LAYLLCEKQGENVMPRNLKFHVLVIASITLGVYSVFYVSGRLNPPVITPAPETQTISPYKISIHEANWGLNCLEKIRNKAKVLQAQQSRVTDKSEIDKIQAELDEILPLPERHNATKILADLCNDKDSCELSFTETSVPFPPANKCRYILDIQYLCSRFDQIRLLKMRYGEQKTLDCVNTEESE
jgi:hypothetical protein